MKNLLLIITLLPFISFSQSPNFSEDIAPIFYNKCTQCHHSGGVAPFSLIDYPTAFAFSNSGAISYMVSNGLMPPWPPDSTYQNYAHERTLNQNEIDLIIDWANIGSPEGNPALAPPEPIYNNENILSNPDLILKIPQYTSTASSEDEYVCFTLPTGLINDKKIKAIEIVPGNRQIVHHTLAFVDNNQLPSVINDCMGVDGKLISTYAPGMEPVIFPNTDNVKMGMTIEANSNIILQMHYPAGSIGQVDSTAIHLFFYDDNAQNIREVFIERLLENWNLFIPANNISSFNASYPLGNNFLVDDYSLLAILPHMHLLGKDIESYSVNASYDTIPLVKINNWDFEWQQFYFFKNLIKLDVGTKLHSKANFDNTSNNIHNPNTPPVDVYAGEATTDEMFVNYLMYTYYESGDENLDLESMMALTIQEFNESLSHNAYPNPTKNAITFEFKGNDANLKIWNILGEKVLDKRIFSKEPQSVKKLESGVYVYQIKNNNGVANRKLIIF